MTGILTRRSAATLILQAVSGNVEQDPAVVRSRLLAEYLRQTLLLLATPHGSPVASEPVYVTRLLHHVRSQLQPLWPDVSESRGSIRRSVLAKVDESTFDPLRHILDTLADLRDVASLGSGYWAPVPLRFVELPAGQVLVVGSLPASILTSTYGLSVEWTGMCRTIAKDTMPQDLVVDQTSWQPFTAWLGRWDDETLAEWTEHYLARARQDLADSGFHMTQFDIYAPALRKNDPQYFRWVPVDQLVDAPKGLVLCRSTVNRVGPRTYWFGQIGQRTAALYLRSESAVDPQDVRRLLDGLDQRDGAPTWASIANDGSDDIVTLRSWLPPEERRLLFALTTDMSHEAGRLPLMVRVSSMHRPIVYPALEALGIVLTAQARRRQS